MEINNKTDDVSVPFHFWEQLSEEDKEEYIKMRKEFINNSSNRHGISLSNDLNRIQSFNERNKENQEIRSIVSGVYFSPNNQYICVNTGQLKSLLGRCKSSINNSFQYMGYSTAKNKIKQTVSSALPPLANDASLLRQWTMRCKSVDSSFNSQRPSPAKKLLSGPQHSFSGMSASPSRPGTAVDFVGGDSFVKPLFKKRRDLPLPLFKSDSFASSEGTASSSSYTSPISLPQRSPIFGNSRGSLLDTNEFDRYMYPVRPQSVPPPSTIDDDLFNDVLLSLDQGKGDADEYYFFEY